MARNAIVGQSGGPTAAINATLKGVIDGAFAARERGLIDKLYGMRNGIEGFLDERFVDLFDLFSSEDDLFTLVNTPAAALGSCRRRLKSYEADRETYERIIAILEKYDIGYFFYIGGNDSMDTVLKLSQYAESVGYDLKVVGVPKTIDNDLNATDHTPGYGSAAKFVATTMKEIMRDISVYDIPAVTIVEVMGRDAGWLTAAAALPSLTGDAPDLIYLPEVSFDIDSFINDVRACLARRPYVLVAVSEGIRLSDGEYVGASATLDAFGHKQLSGAANVLRDIVKERIGCKTRSIELSLPQRCAAHISSLTDITESVGVGVAAVEAAINGASGVMMTIDRVSSSPYSVKYGTANITDIANGVRGVPREFINAGGNGITDIGLEYLRPLIIGETAPRFVDGLPRHIVIK